MKKELINESVGKVVCKAIGELFVEDFVIRNNSCILHNDDTMTKFIDGQMVRKQSCRRKDWSYDWIENVKVEDIDTRYFNLDYSRKL